MKNTIIDKLFSIIGISAIILFALGIIAEEFWGFTSTIRVVALMLLSLSGIYTNYIGYKTKKTVRIVLGLILYIIALLFTLYMLFFY